MPKRLCATLAAALFLVAAGPASAQSVRVSSGSPAGPFSQNKQNEPAVAVDQRHPTVLAAGANDNIDMEACNAGPDNDCPFTEGVGVSGIYFSFDSGHTWTQPAYRGNTARGCLGAVGPDAGCTPVLGPIGTLPNYFEAGLVSDGDPALAFGPQPAPGGGFSYARGSRLYYANLTSALPGAAPFKGAEAIAVSHTDDVALAATGANRAWSAPVIASRQSSAQFSDKEQVWADNAESSSFFGNVYVCYADFRGNGNGFTNQPLMVLTSRDGGASWTQRQVTPATNNISSRNGFGRSGCTVRTDSRGVVYVFTFQFGFNAVTAAAGQIQMIRSFDGGRTFERPRTIFTAFDTCNFFEVSIGRCVEDGVAGARSDLSPAPSVDIANGAPSGADASNRLVISWVDGRDGLNHEHVVFSTSPPGGLGWTAPRNVELAGDRGYYSAPSISPNGSDVWLVYNAFTEPFKESAEGVENDRPIIGQVLRAPVTGSTVGAFVPVHRGLPGDARGSSQNNLAAEFLGDYVYSAATRTYSMSVWNDMRGGADCPDIDEFRQELHEEALETGQPTAEPEEPRGAEDRERGRDQEEGEPVAPPVQQVCPATFGNSDIFGFTSAP
ncbi:MAG TPA: hypothetical protein VFX51_15860 [Solirubrobacteraceae bacterium]|nr:hypothetical protein [Solirubrobacteraceae bacterium]